jgi:serine/threonine-protein kinase
MPISDDVTIRVVDTSALEPGSDFGPRYHIESLLGQGGMGRVYKARDKTLDRTVAIKVIRQGTVGEAGALQRFKQELLLASKVSHKNVLRIHDMGEVGTVKFISMAYVEGPDLYHVLRDNPKLPLERVLSFSRQLAEALAAAHGEGVIHRDLKPQNILVDKDDYIYVSDFGLAKSFEDDSVGMTRSGAFVGTPRYMSPEQVEGDPADQRSDLYAYGLILYEMVTGNVPFTGETTLKVMYQRLQETPKSPRLVDPSIPAWFDAVIMRCLEKDPATRYQTANEILLDLQAAKSATMSRAGTSRIEGRTVQIQIPKFAERRWIWVATAVLTLAILALALPSVRHLIFRGGAAKTSRISGIPPLDSGRFIAVLPLQVLGDQSQLGYLADGIEEALSAKLFQLRDVHVTPEDAVAKADLTKPLPKIAGALGANLVVQGTLQGSGDKIRVVLKLQDTANDKLLWSQEFDGVKGDLFTLEDEIYHPLVSALSLNPTNEEVAKAGARPTENVAAYDLYLRGRNSLRGHDAKSIQSALDFFDQALKTDPTFALAYTGIADASLRMYGARKDSLWTQKALAAAQQADQLNDSLPEVHSTLGAVYSATGKSSEAVSELKRALSLAPNSDEAYRRLGKAYLDGGDGPRAIEAYKKAVQLNPYFWVNQDALGNAYFQLGDYSQALLAFQQITVLEPDIDAGYENVGVVYLQQGKYQECIPYFQKALQIEPFFSTFSNLGTAFFFLKQYTNSAAMFEKAVALNPNNTITMVNLADAYRAAGQQDKSHAAYQQAISLGYKELETNPRNPDVMAQIALAYAKIGNSREAIDLIRRVRAIDDNNVNYIYDAAAINALLGRSSDALKALREALAKHYPAEYAAGDIDLATLQNSPEFTSMMKEYAAAKP